MKGDAVQSADEGGLRRLWAPWRIEYIHRAEKGGCFLCEAFSSQDDRGHLVLYRGSCCGVILNRYPYNNGHLMVAPYRHVPDLDTMNREERHEMIDLLSRSILVLRRTMSAEGFNAGINLGECAGAGVPGHVHLHLVPRWTGDTNFMPVAGGTKVIPQSLDDLWQQLRPAFRS